ncbi:MAG: hypothetical protein MjAS7_1979 [Metallosphaera javensis (ex Sakai et al. 2022)]|nr:MAG: hypothetical protein MjAS7_1979 [Metallosphaera javensis (ex Sakai et al. 2022)]
MVSCYRTTHEKEEIEDASFKPSKDLYKQELRRTINEYLRRCFKPSKDLYKPFTEIWLIIASLGFQTLKGSLQTVSAKKKN